MQSMTDADSMEVHFELDAFSEFLATYPAYKDTMIIDSLRHEEYPLLDEKGHACLDYNGVGLFSGSQIGRIDMECSHITSNLATHAMYTQEGSTESYFRKRVLHYLNLSEEDYYIVFTANALSAFKLLGTSYPFHDAPNLLLAYDHKCENVDAMSECSFARSASVQSVALSLPSCTIDPEDLKKKLHCKRKVCVQKGGAHKGLFAFPYSSRVSGCRSSSSWIQQAQQNGWHVLLDVTSIDAKIMDSLGLCLFLPDFVICSFYYMFGEDPTGLGCLAVKKSVLRTLGDSSRARAIGMVRIMSKQVCRSVESDSPVSVNDKMEHRNSMPLQNPTAAPESQDSKHEPEWSADLMALDNTLFYQSDGDDSRSFKGVLHRVAGERGPHVNSFQRCPYDRERGVSEKGLDSDDDMIDHKAIATTNLSKVSNGCGSSSFSTWMENQRVPIGSFKSALAQEQDFNFPSTSHDQVGIGPSGPMWQSRGSEIEECEPWSSYGTSWIKTNERVPRKQVSENRRDSMGLFCGDVGTLHSTSRASLRRLFKYETKDRVMEHLQRAGQVYSGEGLTLRDWMTYYAEKARLWRSASSSASSSFRFDFEDTLDRQASHRKATNIFLPEGITCKGLDHADMLGYKRVAMRLRCLADWLISSLSRLRHPPPKSLKLVKFCSKMPLAERASTVAFNLADSSGNAFDVKRVQLLADRSNISIRTGVIEGVFTMESPEREKQHEEIVVGCMERSGYKCLSKDGTIQRLEIPVIYVSLGFLNNFSDVYRLWRFVCRFLDPQFVDQELWHYQALNQETIKI